MLSFTFQANGRIALFIKLRKIPCTDLLLLFVILFCCCSYCLKIWLKSMNFPKFWPKETFNLSFAENRKIYFPFVILSQTKTWCTPISAPSEQCVHFYRSTEVLKSWCETRPTVIFAIREGFKVVQSAAANTKAALFPLLFFVLFLSCCFLRAYVGSERPLGISQVPEGHSFDLAY